MVPPDETPSYDDLGISRQQAHRWQKMASVPEETFTDYVETMKAAIGVQIQGCTLQP
jgi:hypothetical protein